MIVSSMVFLAISGERALRYIERLIKDKYSKLHTYLAQQNTHYWAIYEKLQNPYQCKNIELVIHGLLQDNLKFLAELKQTSDDVLKKVSMLRNRIELRETVKTTFTLSEIRDNIRNQYRFPIFTRHFLFAISFSLYKNPSINMR